MFGRSEQKHLVLLFTQHSFGLFWYYPAPSQCFLKWIRIRGKEIEVEPDPAKCSGSGWIRTRIRNAGFNIELFWLDQEKMASNVFGAKQFKPTAPDKGSFPLDHDGECKLFYLKYMTCLAENKNLNSSCRQESKEYLGCRMDKNLMAKEDWKYLGYSENGDEKKKSWYARCYRFLFLPLAQSNFADIYCYSTHYCSAVFQENETLVWSLKGSYPCWEWWGQSVVQWLCWVSSWWEGSALDLISMIRLINQVNSSSLCHGKNKSS